MIIAVKGANYKICSSFELPLKIHYQRDVVTILVANLGWKCAQKFHELEILIIDCYIGLPNNSMEGSL